MAPAHEPRPVSVAGEIVGLYGFGDPAGWPVIAFHGIPSCGAGFAWIDAEARRAGIRLLAPDRPGVGLSTVRDTPTVASHAAQVEALADTLGLGRIGILGYSGGGPYALATAARLGSRVRALAIVAGMGEIGTWAAPGDFEGMDQVLFTLCTRTPPVARVALRLAATITRHLPHRVVRTSAVALADADRDVLQDEAAPESLLRAFTQACLVTTRGMVDDYRATAGDWDVELSAIVAPVRIFHGTADTMVPPRHSEELARRLRHADVIWWSGEGHLGLRTHGAEILEWMTTPAGGTGAGASGGERA